MSLCQTIAYSLVVQEMVPLIRYEELIPTTLLLMSLSCQHEVFWCALEQTLVERSTLHLSPNTV